MKQCKLLLPFSVGPLFKVDSASFLFFLPEGKCFVSRTKERKHFFLKFLFGSSGGFIYPGAEPWSTLKEVRTETLNFVFHIGFL